MYSVRTCFHLPFTESHFPENVGRVFLLCLGTFLCHLVLIGESIGSVVGAILFFSKSIAEFQQKVSCGSVFSFWTHSQELTALTSATEQMNVNYLVGHHFVAQTSSKPIGSCHLLFTPSTHCLMRLWHEMGFTYLKLVHSPFMF